MVNPISCPDLCALCAFAVKPARTLPSESTPGEKGNRGTAARSPSPWMTLMVNPISCPNLCGFAPLREALPGLYHQSPGWERGLGRGWKRGGISACPDHSHVKTNRSYTIPCPHPDGRGSSGCPHPDGRGSSERPLPPFFIPYHARHSAFCILHSPFPIPPPGPLRLCTLACGPARTIPTESVQGGMAWYSIFTFPPAELPAVRARSTVIVRPAAATGHVVLPAAPRGRQSPAPSAYGASGAQPAILQQPAALPRD